MAVLLPFRGGTYYLWKYVPNVPAAAIVAVLWAAVTILLSWRMYKTRTWFCSAFIIGCFSKATTTACLTEIFYTDSS
jgi:hypothetical protein